MNATKKHDMTVPGSVNRNGQRVVGFVRKDSGNPLNAIYHVSCTLCAFDYGAYSNDLWQRKCPGCQEGREGVEIEVVHAD